MRSVRGRTRTPAALAAQSLRVFVLCPFAETASARLVQYHAIRVSPRGRAAGRNRSLARLRLAPPAFASQVLTHVPTSAKPSEIVTLSLLHAFSDRAARFLEHGSEARFAFFVEDDCRLSSHITSAELASAALAAGKQISGWVTTGAEGNLGMVRIC